METRLTEAENRLRALVTDIVGGARVIQGGGNERLESRMDAKVRQAADASLARLFHKFNHADEHRWSSVIERARAGAEHPLAVFDYRGKTEEHSVCAAVLAFVGAGKKGREVRTHFSDPPFGWPRDAIDAALISLFGTGHLRATATGVALHPPQLDQTKVPSTDFRTESATIDARQRLKLCRLFQTAGVDCKPNEETAAAGRLLSHLEDLAHNAGGDAPLPQRPDTQHLSELLSLAGNEQLLAMLDRHDELVANLDEWAAAGTLAEDRLPALRRLETLARHAEGMDVAADVKPQIEAVGAGRRLLDASDPVPGLERTLMDALRAAFVEAESRITKPTRRSGSAWKAPRAGERSSRRTATPSSPDCASRRRPRAPPAPSRRYWNPSTASRSTTGELVPPRSRNGSRTPVPKPTASSSRRPAT